MKAIKTVICRANGTVAGFWGNERGGLFHAMLRRQKKGYGIDFFNDMATVIKEGKKYPNKYSDTRFDLWHKKKQKLIVIETKYGKKDVKFPVTMVKQKNTPKR